MTPWFPREKKLREILREILEPYEGRRDSTRLSLYVDLFILSCILASCALAPLEYFLPSREQLLMRLECLFVAIFVVE